MRSTIWIGPPSTIAVGGTAAWGTTWQHDDAQICRFVFRQHMKALDPLPAGLVCFNMKVGGFDVLPKTDTPEAHGLNELSNDWIKMNLKKGQEVQISVSNEGGQDVTLDVGVEYEVVQKASREASSEAPKIDLSDERLADLLMRYGTMLMGNMRALEGSPLVEAAGSFFARCFNVLEQRLVDQEPREAPVEESVLPLEGVTIKPGETGTVSAGPQLTFKATRWFLAAKRPSNVGHAIDDLVVEGLYAGNFITSAGSGSFPASLLTGGKELSIVACPVGRRITIRLANKGTEEISVGGFVIGEVQEE